MLIEFGKFFSIVFEASSVGLILRRRCRRGFAGFVGNSR